jgi:hypothetical protein
MGSHLNKKAKRTAPSGLKPGYQSKEHAQQHHTGRHNSSGRSRSTGSAASRSESAASTHRTSINQSGANIGDNSDENSFHYGGAMDSDDEGVHIEKAYLSRRSSDAGKVSTRSGPTYCSTLIDCLRRGTTNGDSPLPTFASRCLSRHPLCIDHGTMALAVVCNSVTSLRKHKSRCAAHVPPGSWSL